VSTEGANEDRTYTKPWLLAKIRELEDERLALLRRAQELEEEQSPYVFAARSPRKWRPKSTWDEIGVAIYLKRAGAQARFVRRRGK